MNLRAVREIMVGGGLVLAGALAGCQQAAPESAAPVARPGLVAPARVNPPGRSGDAFVILTGGGTPLTNEYSHYLQARALSDFFHARYPAEAVWTFFGIGNRTGAPGILADVHRQTKDGGLVLDSWFPGALRSNRPATKESFLAALRDEILPRVAGGGTLYLFVGDHGELSPAKDGESAVTMWQLRRGSGGRGWNTDNRGVLTVTELRAALATGLGRGRVVFCMTQCHSGGFHFLGVPRDIAKPGAPPLRVAGFTATDEENVAAGCDPDPDPENWAGYERYIPEALLGADLMTGARRSAERGSFEAAHEAASLVDFTIDLPRSSSEQFLDGWADYIDRKFVRSLAGSATERRALTGYQHALDGRAPVTPGDPALVLRAERFQRLTAALGREFPATAKLLTTGTRHELEAALNAREPRGGGGPGRRGGGATARRLWPETIRPAWKAAVEAGTAGVLPAAAVRFEKRLLELEDGGRDFFSGGGRRGGMLNEVYWQSGQSTPVVTDRARAEAVPRWAAERRQKILEWARSSGNDAVRTAAATLTAAPPRAPGPAREPAINKTAVERVLFYRRVLGAWGFLSATENHAALAQLAALIELEQTPLPPPAVNGM
ncbi:MAG: hypothetical protein HZA93_11720 [Verrucomicrobia bacterium]|nr:hypothetical protein [Verrucomicrobiota bacterium]